jgi:hypothetical protein
VPPRFETARMNGEGNFVVATGERGEPGLIGWYVEKTRGAAAVIVYAHEASEFAGVSDANAWGALVARRFQYSNAIGKPGYRVETTPAGRRMTLVTQVRDGCDPHDGYVGFIEREGYVYEIRVEVAPNTPRRRVEPLEHAFLEEPFGVNPKGATARLGFELPPVPFMPGPC